MEILPLRKSSPGGELYTRIANNEEILRGLLSLSDEVLLERSMQAGRRAADYIPSECLLYLVRNKNGRLVRPTQERLFKALVERVMRTTWSGRRGEEAIDLAASSIHDELLGRFTEILVRDQAGYVDGLDFYEVRFDMALARLRSGIRKTVEREQRRRQGLEDPETEEISIEVEEAVGSESPIDAEALDRADYRSRLDAAIDTLPTLQRRIMEMLKKEIPIDSKDPDAVTIAKSLGKSEKTIRTHRDQAFATLAEILKGHEKS